MFGPDVPAAITLEEWRHLVNGQWDPLHRDHAGHRVDKDVMAAAMGAVAPPVHQKRRGAHRPAHWYGAASRAFDGEKGRHNSSYPLSSG